MFPEFHKVTYSSFYLLYRVKHKLYYAEISAGERRGYQYEIDFERSDECIDFTMMCVFFFFVSVDNIWSSKNASIFDFSPSLKRKLNLVGTLGGQKLKIFNIFEMNREKPQKNEGKRDFLRKTSLRQNRIFYFAIIQKLIDTIEILNFSNSNLYEICQNCENVQLLVSKIHILNNIHKENNFIKAEAIYFEFPSIFEVTKDLL
ncbi:hypothetical protein AGLY_010061 [Aphis glycines]|uniref:Uncharacterized protein n=1 Tax=Aphis glycines TaxID=307491 RepID=A0A6G0TEX9_APHGL|nr:hypothetical protein AGLY_010061 [Aphis glycines]